MRIEGPMGGSYGGDRSPCPTSHVVVVAHELPKRLRLKSPVVGRFHLDTDHLAAILSELDGIQSVRINAGAKSVIIDYDGTPPARERIFSKFTSLGARELQFRETERAEQPDLLPLLLRPALLLAMPFLPPPLWRLLSWVAISPRILRGVQALLNEGVTVEVLDAVAVSLGAGRGQYATAVVTDLLMASGEYLEETTERHSEELLEDLLAPNPQSVWVERDDGLLQLPFTEVKKGDTVVVNVGELVAVDGVVTEGIAQVNQASVTGESVPVRKEVGDHVIAGSMIESGRIKIEAQHVGLETTTARIATFIRESLAAKSETERVAEKMANQRVLFTLGLGLVTFLLTRDIDRVMSVFLVDYACAVKLSAPVAIRSTMSEGAGRGILIKGGPSIEQLAQADTFIFDKTGTLTEGDLVVTDVVPLAPEVWPEQRLLALSASIEEHTSHPIANAIVEAARQHHAAHITHGDIDVEVAHGLKTVVDGEPVIIGSRHYLQDHAGIDLSRYEETASALSAQGKMLLYAAADHTPIGIIGLRDELRDDSRDLIDRLRRSGVSTLIMLSGDRKARAEALGKMLGMDQVIADLEPEEKAQIVERLQREGRKVAFVGDGVNDAPALVKADVGIAMPQGADIARATADILLLEDRITAVADAREASQNAMRIIRSNFAAAIGINTLLFAGASTGWLSPVASAVLHNGSTLGLLGYALSASGFPETPDESS